MAHQRMSRSGPMRWGAAAQAGLLAGAIFLLLEFLMVPLFLGGSAWSAVQSIAAVALGEQVLPPQAGVEGGTILTGLVMHFLVAAAYGLVVATVTRRMPMETAVITGAALGLALYVLHHYVLSALFPWLASGRDWVSVFTHIVFGLAAAWLFARRTGRRTAMHDLT